MRAATQPAVQPTLELARQHHAASQLLQAAEAYRQTLLGDPQSQPALLGLSLIARQSNQLQPALRMAEAALAANSHSALAWANLGDTLLALNHPKQAQAAFQHSLTLDPAQAPANYGLGNTLALQENFAAALNHFSQALRHSPNSPECHFAIAFAHSKLGDHPQAIHHYRRATHLQPTFAAAWLNLGVEHVADGRDQLADRCYHQACITQPANHHTQISAHLNQGHLHRARRQFQQAQQTYLAALALTHQNHPRLSEIEVAFTYLHLEQREFPQAWQSLRQAQKHGPHNPEVPNAKGILLLAEEISHPCNTLVEQAIGCFRQAEALNHKTASSNRGNALLRLGRVREALCAHQLAVDRNPHHPGTRYNLALTQLRTGNFPEGWQNYEARWQFREVHPRPRRLSQPRWQGQPLPANATLLIYSEQGLGDTLQFLRYLPLVAQRLQADSGGRENQAAPSCAAVANGGRDSTDLDPAKPQILLEVQPQLVRLLTPNPHAQVLPHGQPLPPFTQHIPLLSLPTLFPAIPVQIPYLAADPERTRQRAAELARLPGKKVGLNWAGNPNYPADHERSTTLQTFLPLFNLPNIHWISLQNGPAVRQIQQISPTIRPHNLSENDRDLADTAALIANLDLVLTTDTAIAHLAGALGKPLWLLLPWQSDWRWMQEIPTTPWYPQAHLFRQPNPGNWPELIQQIARELSNSH